MKRCIKKNFGILIMLFLLNNAVSQTNISGIINNYATVTSIGSQSVAVNTSAGFVVGDKVLLIQMKGATIDLTNTSNFGTISSYNEAGNYEFCNVASINSTTITFSNPLIRAYNSVNSVQLVKVPVYNNVNVTGLLTCPSWNGTTGGVLAFEAMGNVNLNANIDATGKGFLGGAQITGQFNSCSGNLVDFRLPTSSFISGFKGEGIALSNSLYIKGLGALANGGGAGNDVNGGGAGGGNFGIGGHGGNSKCSTSPIALCGGSSGKNCTYSNSSNKIFLGGGGGSGHENDGVSTAGVSGGGIIIIRCGGIISGNGNFINSNGSNNTLIAGNDGQGGGGAGGTVLLEACSTSSLSISVIGGNGGTDNFGGPDCHGKGGGGGGGVIWTSTLLNYISFLNGGNPGMFTNANSQCFNTSNGATTGQIGGTLTGLSIPGAVPLSLGTSSLSISSICANTTATATGSIVTSIIAPSISYTWTNASGQIISQTNNSSVVTNSIANLANGIYTLTAQINAPCGPICSQTVNINCVISPTSSCQGSLLFDAAHPAVDLPAISQYYSGTNGGYTWECWFKLNQPFGTDMRPLISSVDGVLFEDQWLGFGWQGGWFNEPVTSLVFKVDGPNSTTPTGPNCAYTPPGGYVLGTWYHAAGVMDYTNQISKLFLNGVLVDSKPITTPPITRVIPTQLCLNWGGTPLPLFGNMDEVRIWERALPNAEILANYNHCLTGNEQNLLLYYRCNQSSGATIFDATPNNNVGTFSNLPSWSTQEPVITGTACATSSNTLSVVNSNSVICAGTTVTLSANGAPSYTWSTGSNNSSISVTPLVTTSYTVSSLLPVCSGINFSNSIITVSVNPTPTITSTTFSNTSCGLSNGSATVTSIPSTNTYSWSSGLTSTTSAVNALAAGNYSVTVYNGTCQTNTVVSILSSVPLQIVSNTITGSDCGVNNGSILVNDNLVSSSYSWTPNVSSSNNLSNLSPGTYSVLITNGVCTTTAAYNVPQLNGPSAINVIQSDAICESLSGAISVTSVSNGVGPYQFSFNNLGYSSVSSFSNLAQGVYTITIKDFNGCIYSNTVVINKVSVTSTIDLITNLPTCNTNDGSFVINNILGGTKPYSFIFNGLSYSTDTLFEELGSGNYVLVIKDSNLCETNLMLNMPFDKNDYTLYVPNSFTPNKDVVNDMWFVKGTCINSFNCLIFNRWGERIMELVNINETWDGTFKGKNVPDGVYVYLIEAETNNGTIYRNGHITVFR